MNALLRPVIGVAATLLAAGAARGEAPPNNVPAVVTDEAPAAAEEPAASKWSFAASLDTYVEHHGTNYVQPTIAADRDWLHLEGRYNDEGLDTGSFWVGYNSTFGKRLQLDFTPMVGGVVGGFTGIAPGYELTLSYWKLELYSQGEYVFDQDRLSDSFFYNWSSVKFSPVEWSYVGMVTQRTKIRNQSGDVERGPLVGFTRDWADVSVYCLDPFSDNFTLVFSVGVTF